MRRLLTAIQIMVIIAFYLTQAEGLVTGTAVKLFTIAGPVIVFGTLASAAYGIVLVILGGGGP